MEKIFLAAPLKLLMMRKGLVEQRMQYVSMIHNYERRRAVLTEKFPNRATFFKPVKGHSKMPKKQAKIARQYSFRIRIWNKAIRRIDKRLTDLSNLERAVTAFTGIKLSAVKGHIGLVKDPHEWVAKAIYYKYGLEHQMKNMFLRNYIGLGRRQNEAEPAKYRIRFTRSFVDTPKNKEIWMSFNAFFEKDFKLSNLAGKRAYSTIPSKIKDNQSYRHRA